MFPTDVKHGTCLGLHLRYDHAMSNDLPHRTVVVDHPLVQHKLSLLREKETGPTLFRALVYELGLLLAYAATHDLACSPKAIETPLVATEGTELANGHPVLISILRAGNGLLDGMLAAMPTARVGHVGLFRNADLEAVEYYFKVPALADRDVLVVDPMLATAHTAIAAFDRLAATGAASIRFVCLVAAPEGLANFHEHHPDITVYTAAVDERLNEKGYILPGLGDAGDRLYGTLHD